MGENNKLSIIEKIFILIVILGRVKKVSPSTDICDFCFCRQTAIICNFKNFNAETIRLDNSYYVPQKILKITLYLEGKKILMASGFLKSSRINSVIVIGIGSETEQLEIGSKSFDDNKGPYPEILLNKINAVFLRSNAISGNYKLTTTDCKMVIVYENAFENAEFNGHFQGIQNLSMHENALHASTANILFERCHFKNLYRLGGKQHVVQFRSCIFLTIEANAFDIPKVNSTTFIDCNINTVKSRAFTERLHSPSMLITNSIIGSIETHAIYGTGIGELTIQDTYIGRMADYAIDAIAVNVTILQNNITHIGKNGIRIQEGTNILIKNNTLGTFNGISVQKTQESNNCSFEYNSITDPKKGSLNIGDCIIREIPINRPCKCTSDWLEELSEHDLRSQIYCNVDDILRSCLNSTNFNAEQYHNEVCSYNKTEIICKDLRHVKNVDGVFYTKDQLEEQQLRFPTLQIVIFVMVILTLVICTIAFFILRKKCINKQQETSAESEFAESERTVLQEQINPYAVSNIITGHEPNLPDIVHRGVEAPPLPQFNGLVSVDYDTRKKTPTLVPDYQLPFKPQYIANMAPLIEPENHYEYCDIQGFTVLPRKFDSDHSGGSHETMKIDDVVEYIDI